MKKFALFLVLAWVFSGAYAEASLTEKMNSNGALLKFSRGVTNIATSPGEFVTQVPNAMEKSPDYLTGFIVSLGRGLGHCLLRAGAGIYDIATFPFPGPTNYRPIIKPKTIAEEFLDTTVSKTLPA